MYVAQALAVEREKEKVHQYSMGLNEKCITGGSQILNTDPLPSSSRAYAQVAQEERQKIILESQLPFVDGAALVTNTFNKSNNNHKSKSNPDLSKLFCDHCKTT